MVENKPPLPDKYKRLARDVTADLIRDGLIKFAEEIDHQPVVCVIRWQQTPISKTENYSFVVYDLGIGEEAAPLVNGVSDKISDILDVAEDYKAFVVFCNKSFTREVERYTRPAVLVETA